MKGVSRITTPRSTTRQVNKSPDGGKHSTIKAYLDTASISPWHRGRVPPSLTKKANGSRGFRHNRDMNNYANSTFEVQNSTGGWDQVDEAAYTAARNKANPSARDRARASQQKQRSAKTAKQPTPTKGVTPTEAPATPASAASAFGKYTGMTTNPLLAGGLMAGAGYLGGRYGAPLIKWLYPELDDAEDSKLGWVGAAAAGIPAAGLSYLLMRKGAAWGKRVDHGKIRTDYLREATGAVDDGPLGAAFQRTIQNASRNGIASQRAAANEAKTNGFMSAIGGYVNPINRLGFGIAAAGASRLTGAMGVRDRLSNTFGMPVDRAVRVGMPGLGLLSAGFNLMRS